MDDVGYSGWVFEEQVLERFLSDTLHYVSDLLLLGHGGIGPAAEGNDIFYVSGVTLSATLVPCRELTNGIRLPNRRLTKELTQTVAEIGPGGEFGLVILEPGLRQTFKVKNNVRELSGVVPTIVHADTFVRAEPVFDVLTGSSRESRRVTLPWSWYWGCRCCSVRSRSMFRT